MLYTVLQYFFRILITLSMLLNVVLGGPIGQTFSARNWEWHLKNKPNLAWLLDWIFSFDPDHCHHSWCTWKYNNSLRKMSRSIDHQIDNLLEAIYKYQE
jgi:hypothetical protein